MDWPADFTSAARLAIRDRDSQPLGYLRCVVCGGRIFGRHVIHHRKRKSGGGDGRPSNGITVCGLDNKTSCHGRIHGGQPHPDGSGRRWAEEAGYWVSAHHLGELPPLLCAWRGWIVLDDEGGWAPAGVA